MIRALSRYFSNVPPMFIDGCLYACLGVFTFWGTFFGSDEAAKHMSTEVLFWTKCLVGTGSSFFLAVKLFRSTSFADHQEAKKQTGNTEFLVKPTEEKERVKND